MNIVDVVFPATFAVAAVGLWGWFMIRVCKSFSEAVMSIALVLLFLVLGMAVGCAPYPTMEELETEAMQTGDWSKVESRQRAIERRAERRGPTCPSGYVAFKDGQKDWICIPRQEMQNILKRMSGP